MKKQKLLIIGTILLLAVSLSSCSKPPGFTVGKWNQDVFENSWLNMQFEITSDWDIATKEEITALIGVGAEMLDIEGTSTEQLKAAVELKTIYAFMVSQPGLSVQLFFENLSMTTGAIKYSASQYLDEVSKFLIPLPEIQYKLVNKRSTQIANKEFAMMVLTGYEGNLLQDYYAYKIDNFMVSMIVSYSPDMESEKSDFVKNIKVFK